jgi:hypothetical protein
MLRMAYASCAMHRNSTQIRTPANPTQATPSNQETQATRTVNASKPQNSHHTPPPNSPPPQRHGFSFPECTHTRACCATPQAPQFHTLLWTFLEQHRYMLIRKTAAQSGCSHNSSGSNTSPQSLRHLMQAQRELADSNTATGCVRYRQCLTCFHG